VNKNSKQHLVWLEINLANIVENLKQFKQLAKPAQILPVVKSNAYGHGIVEVAKRIAREGIWGLGVFNTNEAIELARANITLPILILGPVPLLYNEVAKLFPYRSIRLVIYDRNQAKILSNFALKNRAKIKVHIKIDTGLNRLSVHWQDAVRFVKDISLMQGLELEGVYSHLSDAEGLDQSYTLKQLHRFKQVISELESCGVYIPLKHIAGSAAAMLLPESRYDLVRIGISLYGLWPSKETRLLMLSRVENLSHLLMDRKKQEQGVNNLLLGFLKPALQFKTRIVQIKKVPKGSPIGYGCNYWTKHSTKIAILPVGYAEGFDRGLSNCGEVLIKGKRASVVGNVCMNMTMVDITHIRNVRVGEEVVLIGKQGKEEITAEDLAEKIGTINYEIVTRLNWSLPRIYLEEKNN